MQRLARLRDRYRRSRLHALHQRWSGYFPLTASGMIVLAFCAFLYLNLWRVHRDYVAYLAVCIMAAVMALLLALVLLAWGVTRRRLRASRTLPGEILETDRWQPSGFEVPVPFWLPCVQVEWTWDRPVDVELRLRHERGRMVEDLRPLRRGIYDSIIRRITVTDVIGLCAMCWTVEEPVDLRVLPARGTLDQMTLLSSLFTSDEISDPRGEPFGDRVDMRQYTAGDSPRMILWKVYARTRRLMVRVPERAVTAQPRTCAYLLAGQRDEATAGMAAVMLERNLLGEGWRFGADRSYDTASQLPHALEILAKSGNPPASDTEASGFETFLGRAERDGYSCCILFAPPCHVPSAELVRACLARSRVRVYVMVGIDPGRLRGAEKHAWLRYLLRPAPADFVRLAELEQVADFWRGAKSDVIIADRQAGRIYTDTRALSVAR